MALVVKTVIVVLPLLVGIATTAALSWLVPHPSGRLGTLWWVGALAVSALAVALVIRLLERFLPLVALLRFSLAFPDHTPSRTRLALRAGSIRRLEERVAELRERGEQADVATAAENVVVIAAGLTVHDRRTRGHSERVRALSELIAEQMHLDVDQRDRLRWASLLHDCGKVTVDAKILNKSSKLEDDEWALIRRHPEEGARIALPLRDWLGEWSLAIAQHHERYDGSGYPRGLKGDEISLAARIVAVADSYDAMTSLRSYQKPMSPEAARAELTRKAGTDFDPDVVRAFLRCSRGRVGAVLGPLSWLTMIPLAGTGVASAAEATMRRGRTAATVAGGGGAVAAAALLGIVAPVAGPAALAAPRRPPASANATQAPEPEIQILPAGSGTPAPAPAPAPAAAAASAPAPKPSVVAVRIQVPAVGPLAGPTTFVSTPPAPPAGPPPSPTTTPPTPFPPKPPLPPPPGSQAQVDLSPIAQVSVSTRQPLPVCAPVNAGVVKVRC
ncbi:MAG: HD-GYP domain-containing protein [Acidimicrobiia bacterium]|nr:HD-GYP domain-containing protein [Acidimicrobiia bacterium]